MRTIVDMGTYHIKLLNDLFDTKFKPGKRRKISLRLDEQYYKYFQDICKSWNIKVTDVLSFFFKDMHETTVWQDAPEQEQAQKQEQEMPIINNVIPDFAGDGQQKKEGVKNEIS